MTPFRLDIKSECVASVDTLKANAEANKGYPSIHRRLAIVGGGPSVASHLEELRAWDGDIWAVNKTYRYLKQNGIDSIFITVDPAYADYGYIDKAILASSCHPEMVRQMADRGTDIRMFHMAETHEGGVFGGITTARRGMSLSIMMGYRDVHIFGCEGNYESGQYCAYPHTGETDSRVIVRAGGKDYETEIGLIVQNQEIGMICSTFGQVFKNRSGGLLQAMMDNEDTWEVVAVCEGLKAHLEEVNGAQGLYETPYKVAA